LYEALNLAKKINDQYDLCSIYGNLGKCFGLAVKYSTLPKYQSVFNRLRNGNKTLILQDAEKFLDTAITIGKEIGDLYNLIGLYENMSEIKTLQGNYKEALLVFQQKTKLNDSLFNAERDKKVTQNAMQYEFDKKELTAKTEQDKKDARQRVIRNSIIAGLLAALIFLLLLFRQRNKIKKEKERSEELLLNILPSEVAEELKSNGEAEAKLHNNVSVLFTDFKGFTQLSEKLSAKELIAELNHCFMAFDKIIVKNHIEKIKTIGDAYMAVSGLPIANEKHAINMVTAAIEIRDFMAEYKQQRLSENKPFFELRLGIHSGDVVAGIVGIKKFAYDVWGDTVNTASRMESSGEVGKINISETTYQLVKDNFSCEFRGSIDAKGKGMMNMYFVS
jgi:adenylate cyclase